MKKRKLGLMILAAGFLFGCDDNDAITPDNTQPKDIKAVNACTAGQTRSCYSGPKGTENIGICKSGYQECIADSLGTHWASECIDEVLPDYTYSCRADDILRDNDCNGIPDSQQDDDGDGLTICSNMGRRLDCCDNEKICIPANLRTSKRSIRDDCVGDGLDNDCNGIIDDGDRPCTPQEMLLAQAELSGEISDTTCGSSTDTFEIEEEYQECVSHNFFGICNGYETRTRKVLPNTLSGSDPGIKLAHSMDICATYDESDPESFGLIEAVLSTSKSKNSDTTRAVSSNQVSMMSGMKNSSGVMLISPRGGENFAMLSSGHASDVRGGVSQNDSSFNTSGSVPAVYLEKHNNRLQSSASCSGSSANINDSVQLHLKLKAPETAQGFSFDFRFFSREYPYYVCSEYNDFFMAIVTDENGKPFIDIDGDGSTDDEDGNISFDKSGNAVSVNNAFFTTCSAPTCGDTSAMGYTSNTGCPANYTDGCVSNHCGACEDGYKELYAYIPKPYIGTGSGSSNKGGGTAWLTTMAPVTGGQVFNLDFYIWDTYDDVYDSTVIIDNFKWRTGVTTVGTDFSTGNENEDNV